MKRVYFMALVMVVAIIGIASFITVSPLLQPKPRPVTVTFGVISRNGAGGCLNLVGIPLTILKLDGVTLSVNSTTVLDTGANSTTVTLMSGTVHSISANQTYTGRSNHEGDACPEGGGPGNVTAFFGEWENATSTIYAKTLEFVVPQNGSATFVADYWVD